MSTITPTKWPEGRPWARWALCILLFAAGAWCLGNTASMNFVSGLSLADTDLGKIVQPSSVLVIDVMAAILAIVVLSMIADRKWLPAFFLGVVLLGFMAYSTKNVIGFGARERMEKQLRIERNNEASTEAIASSNALTAGAHERNLSWLRDEYRRARTDADKSRLLNEIQIAASTRVEVKAETVDTLMGDPEAQVIAGFFGWSVATYIFWNQLALAILQVLGKTLGFGLSAALWPRRPARAAAASRYDRDASDRPASDVPLDARLEEEDIPEAVAVPMAASLESLSVKALEGPGRRPAPNGSRVDDLQRARELGLVRRFIDAKMIRTEGREIAGVVEGVPGEPCHQMFIDHLRASGNVIEISQKAFSRHCAELGVKKVRAKGLVYYALLPVQEAPAAQIAA